MNQLARLVMFAIIVFTFPNGSFAQTQTANAKKKQPKPLPSGVTAEKDIVFTTTEHCPLKLDVYRPVESDGPLPTILFIHGGGWAKGDKASALGTAAWIVPDGYAVVSANYRLTGTAQWPAQINDCYEAVRWVRRNAGEYGFDGNRIGVWGTSAGGHLVALMGTRPSDGTEKVSSHVQAVCDWFGPTDLLTMPPNVVTEKRSFEQVAKSNGAKLLGAPVPTIPEKAKQASAFHNVSPDDAPTLIMHGSEDPGVPLEQSEKFFKALQAAGVPSTLHIVQGAGHGGKEFQSEESREVVRQFFAQHLQSRR